ncbi:TRF4/5 nucletotidyl transferase [Cryptosporidium ryanae]|uniref:TRF4/5 nucletotidyl transferase n=1 Tax=Cryptosporidium ryanae TaxID=515981 RepID=UPI00351A7EDE|nr:TRF4/5 nucletotidyl transferase [Cryptosporidium ryanae]
MSEQNKIELDGPDQYLLDEEERVRRSLELNNSLRLAIQSRKKPETSKMVDTFEYININSLKRKRNKKSCSVPREKIKFQKEACTFIVTKEGKEKIEMMKLPWETIPSYINYVSNIDIFFIHLNNEIVQLVRWLELTENENLLRARTLARIIVISHSLWPESKVQLFGSYYTGLSLPSGDIDVCILNVSGDPKRRLRELAKVLKDLKLCTGIELILTAKVPIIKYVDSEACISVDVSLSQESSIDTTKHIAECLEKFGHLRPLLLIIKLMLHQRGLDETYLGGLGSYSQFGLVLSFLQQHSSSYSLTLYRSTTLGHLLFDFLELFGIIFNYNNTGIRLREKGEYFHKSDPSAALFLESPLPPFIDMGKGAFKYSEIKESFRLAFIDLVEAKRRFNKIRLSKNIHISGNPENFSILSSIISIDDELFQCRIKPLNESHEPISAPRSPPFISKEIIKQVKHEIDSMNG